MTQENSKQLDLTSSWKIPAYAHPYIKIKSNVGQIYNITGDKGTFRVTGVPPIITVCWGEAPLTQLQTDALDWSGQVRLGGFVTSIHMTQLQAIDIPLAIITMEAFPLKPDIRPYLAPEHRNAIPYTAPDFLDGIDDDASEGVTTWIADVDSPLLGTMQDAMNQGHRIYAFGRLANESDGWQELFALPILLESVTTFMNG